MTKIDGFLKSLAGIKLKLKNGANSTIKRQRETIRRLKSKIIRLERKVKRLELKLEQSNKNIEEEKNKLKIKIDALEQVYNKLEIKIDVLEQSNKIFKEDQNKLVIRDMLYYTEDRLFRTIHPLLAELWIHFRLKDIKSGFNDYDNKADSEAAIKSL